MFDLLEEKKEEKIRVFDLETQKTIDEVGGEKNIDLVKVSVGVAYLMPENEHRVYTEDNIDDLIKLLLEDTEVAVTFNGCWFDFKVLTLYTDNDFSSVPHVDMFLDYKEQTGKVFGVGLDNIAMATLGVGKTSEGLQAIEWWREYERTGDSKYIENITEYCKEDTNRTNEVYQYGEKYNKIFYTNKNGKLTEAKIKWKKRTGKPIY